MIQTYCRVISVRTVGPNIFVLRAHSPEIASKVLPGQFINIKVNDCSLPLLRRPFSVYRVEGENVEIIFNAIGLGTRILSQKRQGEMLDILGPLGCSFGIDDHYTTAILVAGGLGVAPMPLLTDALTRRSKNIMTFLGARTRDQLVTTYLNNVRLAADDGSAEFHGTVVDHLRSELQEHRFQRSKIFACGPNVMLKSLSKLAEEFKIHCEVSLESVMACGIGICQGCPVETVHGGKKFALICKEGTVFDTRDIRILVDGQH